jgi:hypothetical protein
MIANIRSRGIDVDRLVPFVDFAVLDVADGIRMQTWNQYITGHSFAPRRIPESTIISRSGNGGIWTPASIDMPPAPA